MSNLFVPSAQLKEIRNLDKGTVTNSESKSTLYGRKNLTSYGLLLSDGTLVEAIYDETKRPSLSFLVAPPDGPTSEANSFTDRGEVFSPPTGDVDVISGGTVTLASGVADYGTPALLIEELYKYLRRSVDLEQFQLKLMANWTLMTYAYDAWDAVPYLRFKGEPGTGKTRCLAMLQLLCYRATDLGVGPSKSALFRTSDRVRGTMLIDEADYEGDLRSDLIQLLNAGYKKNGTMTISSPHGDDWKAKPYRVGGPKALANREDFPDRATETRCVTIHTVQKPLAPHIPTRLPPSFMADAAVIRKKLLQWRIDNARSLPSLEGELSCLEARAREICLPLYSCSPDPDFRQELLQWFKCHTMELRHEEPSRIVLESIIACRPKDQEAIPVARIRKNALVIAARRDLPDRHFAPKRVADLLRGLRFETKRRNDGAHFYFDAAVFEQQCKRFEISIGCRDGSDADAKSSTC